MIQQSTPTVPELEVVNGEPMTTSLKVAQYFGKRHDNVIRAIRNLDYDDDLHALNFEETLITTQIPNGGSRQDKAYLMTKEGFLNLVFTFTGKTAGRFRNAFIREFHRMEQELNQRGAFDPYTAELLSNLASHYKSNDMVMIKRAEYEAMKDTFDNLVETFRDVQSERLEMQLQAFDAITERIEKTSLLPESKLRLIK
ncbi:Rha family transcriptional regulator [Vibrio vulnificus]|uniref:Rha family transcriptional regulator n=1 Tax=Vibrio vulnificus TaxID=672 RepID=UPI0019D4B7E9|nr:Rha family transcriptional regulator [Vibrio vulnificus]MBN8093917.1 Rha family transcriptional regulator [Vibrio vulnificus]MBN8145521.1 Rha family transcriptional regulator [Vibrio vulnificus]HAS6162369.1 hypothetical protein [Vibrio vulnificus]